ncbi:tetratricopeptide repeat protein [Candidatus Gracilibacteria bacterium]|nr:tetratricopeptide repeat protein [Candidatus Gracilibacteria bacterium]
MATEELLDFDAQNKDAYEALIVTIEAKEQAMSLLIAVCDDLNLREQIIAKYEAELQPHFRLYRITLARGEPSLYDALAQLVQNEEYLRQGGKAVITVTGSEQLYFLKLENERSEQEIFFGYLQWTREALREFPYPIILWVTNQMLVNLIKKAPDFWSWREGVFRFVSRKTITVSSQDIEPIRLALNESELSSINDDNPYFLPIEDLQQLIQQKEQQGKKDSSLATLYFSLGRIYSNRLERGEFQDYQKEIVLAIEYYRKAIELQKELGLERDLATSLNSQTYLYYAQGRYNEAEPLFQQALELRKRLLGENHPDVATSLNNLALLYKAQGRYAEAEPIYQQALELCKRLLGEDHPNLATSLSNLAKLYKAQERYSEAEPLFVQALELRKRLLGEDHPYSATSLNNLALLYYAQGRYAEAEPLYQQALELYKRLLGEDHPDVASSLNDLAELYRSQGRYSEAEPLYHKALEISDRVLGVNHPNTNIIRQNLAELRANMNPSNL